MPQHHSPTHDIQRNAERAASQPWVEKLARFGYAAKGVVYFIVGILALQAAIGTGGRTTDTQGALTTIVQQPFGKFLLALVAIGLIGYVIWRVVQATLDPEHPGNSDAKDIAQRIGYGFSALAYAGLALTAIQLIFSVGSGGGGDGQTQDWTARLLAQPFGQWLLGIIGAITIGVGFSFLYEAYKAKFRKHFKSSQMSQKEQQWAKWIGQFGIAARGVVFVIIGFFLIQAALQSNAGDVRGLAGALAALAQQPFGPWLLGLMALGLISYSIHCVIEARYRRIQNSAG